MPLKTKGNTGFRSSKSDNECVNDGRFLVTLIWERSDQGFPNGVESRAENVRISWLVTHQTINLASAVFTPALAANGAARRARVARTISRANLIRASRGFRAPDAAAFQGERRPEPTSEAGWSARRDP